MDRQARKPLSYRVQRIEENICSTPLHRGSQHCGHRFQQNLGFDLDYYFFWGGGGGGGVGVGSVSYKVSCTENYYINCCVCVCGGGGGGGGFIKLSFWCSFGLK